MRCENCAGKIKDIEAAIFVATGYCALCNKLMKKYEAGITSKEIEAHHKSLKNTREDSWVYFVLMLVFTFLSWTVCKQLPSLVSFPIQCFTAFAIFMSFTSSIFLFIYWMAGMEARRAL